MMALMPLGGDIPDMVGGMSNLGLVNTDMDPEELAVEARLRPPTVPPTARDSRSNRRKTSRGASKERGGASGSDEDAPRQHKVSLHALASTAKVGMSWKKQASTSIDEVGVKS